MNRVCTLLFVADYIRALSEWSGWIFEHMAQAQGITIQPTLLTQLATERAQRLVIKWRVVYVLSLIHFPHSYHVSLQEKAFRHQPMKLQHAPLNIMSE